MLELLCLKYFTFSEVWKNKQVGFSVEKHVALYKKNKIVLCYFSLDLDKWINDPPSESSEGEQDLDAMFMDMEETVHR